MKDALLFKVRRHAGKIQLDGLIARVAVGIPFPPDVVVFQNKIFIMHYEGVDEIYYREAQVHHLQKNQILVDGREFLPNGSDDPPV